jgi:hypothetical protein
MPFELEINVSRLSMLLRNARLENHPIMRNVESRFIAVKGWPLKRGEFKGNSSIRNRNCMESEVPVSSRTREIR